MKIAVGNDLVGFGLIKEKNDYFTFKEIKIKLFRTFKTDRMNYPKASFKVSRVDDIRENDIGILVWGTEC